MIAAPPPATIPRAIRGPVCAMARPRRPAAERDAVRGLASPTLSARRNADLIARKVVRAYLADLERDDPMARALFDVQQRLEPDPAHTLATAHDSAASERFVRERKARFEARGCRQLSRSDWERETAKIATVVRAYLSRRFRDHLGE